jgi:hypothetical protein
MSPMSAQGLARRFEHPMATSALPPKATKSLHCGRRRKGPEPDIPSASLRTVKYVTDLQCEA